MYHVIFRARFKMSFLSIGPIIFGSTGDLVDYLRGKHLLAAAATCSKCTAINVYQWLREVCSTTLINGPPILLGGPGKVVQIDESLFRHKPKVIYLYQIYNKIIMIQTIHSYKVIQLFLGCLPAI